MKMYNDYENLTAEGAQQLINKEADEHNAEIFPRYFGYGDDKALGKCVFTCVLCGRKTCISSGASNQGRNFICVRCRYEAFLNDEEMFKFIGGE